MLNWFKRRRKFKTKDYALELGNFSRECLEAVYEEGGAAVVFAGERVGRKWEQINLQAPAGLPEAAYARVLPNVLAGLEALGYVGLVFRTGPGELIPQVEQEAATARLREIGMEPIVAPDGSSIQLRKIPDWKQPPGFDARAHALETMKLARTAGGKRTRIEILAKSEAAVVDFL
jgi:hypothetical protein